MSVFEPNSLQMREVLIFCFHSKKTASEAHRMLSSTYGEAALSKRTFVCLFSNTLFGFPIFLYNDLYWAFRGFSLVDFLDFLKE